MGLEITARVGSWFGRLCHLLLHLQRAASFSHIQSFPLIALFKAKNKEFFPRYSHVEEGDCLRRFTLVTAWWQLVINDLLRGSWLQSGAVAAACFKELAGAKQHKAITLRVVGDCVHKCCSHWRQEVFTADIAGTVMQLNVNQRRKRGNWRNPEKPTGNVGDTVWCSVRGRPQTLLTTIGVKHHLCSPSGNSDDII